MKRICFVLVSFFSGYLFSSIESVQKKVQEKDYVHALAGIKKIEHQVPFLEIDQLFDLEKQSLAALSLPVAPSWHYMLRKILLCIPIVLVQLLLFLLLCLLLISFFVSHVWMQRQRRAIIVGIAMCSFVWFLQYQILHKTCGFVVKDFTFVYAGPEQTFHTISQLKLGSKVQVLDCQAGMCHIPSGWVIADHIEVV